MISLDYFGSLLANETRIEAFRKALSTAVGPGDRVLEVGTGLGTYALFAAAAGASRVWGVERTAVAGVAEQLVSANGLADRVEVVRGDAREVELPAPVDVLVFEDFPVRLLDGPTWALLARAQEALTREGRMVPRAARLNVAPVHAPDLHHRIFPFDAGDGQGRWMGLDWRALRPLLANCPRQETIPPDRLLAPPVSTGVLSLRPPPTAEQMAVVGAWDATSEAPVHALALWFDLEVGPDLWISNEPRARPEPWGQTILPLDPPLPVEAGARVEVAVRREALPSGAPGWLTWEVRCRGESRRGHEFGGIPLEPEDLRGAGGA